MSAGVTHLAKSATFTPAGGSAWNMTSLSGVEIQYGGNHVSLLTDGSITPTAAFLDAVSAEITITVTDDSQMSNAGCIPGTIGSLVCKFGLRLGGVGMSSSSNTILTFSNVVLKSVSPRASATGESQLVLQFSAFDPSGLSVVTVSTGA